MAFVRNIMSSDDMFAGKSRDPAHIALLLQHMSLAVAIAITTVIVVVAILMVAAVDAIVVANGVVWCVSPSRSHWSCSSEVGLQVPQRGVQSVRVSRTRQRLL